MRFDMSNKTKTVRYDTVYLVGDESYMSFDKLNSILEGKKKEIIARNKDSEILDFFVEFCISWSEQHETDIPKLIISYKRRLTEVEAFEETQNERHREKLQKEQRYNQYLKLKAEFEPNKQ